MKMSRLIWRIGGALFIICAAWIISGNINVVKASNVYQEHWIYELINGDSEVKIVMYNDPTVTEIVIPSEIDGKPVTQIGDDAFCFYEDGIYFANLKNVTIPEGVKSIGAEAFRHCINLETVELPESVTSIGGMSFYECSNLTNVKIPAGLTWLGGRAFAYCSKLQSITIPEGITNIPDEAFIGCTGLKSIIIPEGVKTISDLAFADCSDLTIIEIPKSVYYISDKNPFANCSSLETFKVAGDNDGGFYTGNCNALIKILGEYDNEELDAVIYSGCNNTVIPEGLSRIGINEQAFYGCTGLKSIPFEKVKKIGDWAFRGCSSLTSISFNKEITDIPSAAFYGCSGLETLTVAEGNELYESKDNTVIKKDTKEVVLGCKNSVIPNDTKKIGDWAFRGCSGLESITIPGSVKEIGEYAFEDCTGLKSITISDGVEKINAYAFGCSGVISLVLPDSVTYLHSSAFTDCSSLKSITIPGSTEINEVGYEDCDDSQLFYGCTSLEEINIGESNPSYSTVDGVMYNKNKTTLVSYPAGKGGEYTMPETVTFIEAGAFTDSNLEKVILSSKLASISPEAFSFSNETPDTKKINVTVPEEMDVSGLGLENIQATDHVVIYVAEGSTAALYLEKYKLQITVITYKSGTTKADDKTIDKTDSSSDSTTGGEKKTDDQQESSETAVVGKTYEVGNGKYKITSTGEAAFTAPKSKSIKKITIPATVAILDKSYKVTAVSKGACKESKKLTTVTVGKNVKTIGDEAFMNCKKLNKATVGESVTGIGKKAFSGDKKLKKLIFKGAKVKKVGKKALSGVPKNVKITAPKKAVSKYKKLLNKAK